MRRNSDELLSVLQCRTCRQIVRLQFAAYDDDRRREHDFPEHGGQVKVCKRLEPVEIGPMGLQIHVEQKWLHKESERGGK